MMVHILNDGGVYVDSINIPDTVMLHKDVGHGRVISVVAAAIVSYVESANNSAKASREAKDRERAIDEMTSIAQNSTEAP